MAGTHGPCSAGQPISYPVCKIAGLSDIANLSWTKDTVLAAAIRDLTRRPDSAIVVSLLGQVAIRQCTVI